ncbi:ATP-binding protein [Cupriavidus sp. USMAHM13]|uniref:ATP-binding protein n=1 Tax=Cupriavidus sp. USMAHM13 TaxID=1389192 RepID=UPI0009F48F33|nr:ATP-binding protein [Cupriavidus sp. USMAHM13]
MTKIPELGPDVLYTACDPSSLGFTTTEEVAEFDPALIHPRAVNAMFLGLQMDKPGYNVFVLGDSGSGRHAIVRRLLEQVAQAGPPPKDWCYVYDFSAPTRARLLQLPCGRGIQLRNDMQDFAGEIGPAIASAFESNRYQERVEALQADEKRREEAALVQLGEASRGESIALMRTPQGLIFAPLKDSEETLTEDEFAKLPEERQRILRAKVNEYYEKLQRLTYEFPRWRRNTRKAIKKVSSEALRLTVGHLIAEIKPAYADLPAVLEYFDTILQDVIETGESLHESHKSDDDTEILSISGGISVQRFMVNLLVENPTSGARPIVQECNPTLGNLVGRVDHRVHMGTMLCDFMLIKAGALHRANGGFLLLDALDVLSRPQAWEGLKRALRAGEIRTESLADVIGLNSVEQLQPEPVPLDIKVILVGERQTYYLLADLDPDFGSLFKINADLESEINRTAKSSADFAKLIAALARADHLRPLSAPAVARMIEHASRLAGDAQKLSTLTLPLCNILQESDYMAAEVGASRIERTHVEAALMEHRRRNQRVEEAYREQILRGQLLIDTSGEHIGQVNGLALIALGEGTFSHPVRITATARMGEGEIVDIEREVELGGPIHSKGVLILSSFLAARFGWAMPLSLRATLVFEQSYSEVEGDSASLAELAGLLSALSGIPIRQAIAVSGSVNQFGVVQPVGGINEKVQGFFEVCAARGLSGDQGVLLPAANVCHLMLPENVVAAVREGRFHLWAVKAIDEAMELLTGVTAGEPDASGEIPQGTVNYQVAIRLAELAELWQNIAGASPGSRPRRRNSRQHSPEQAPERHFIRPWMRR